MTESTKPTVVLLNNEILEAIKNGEIWSNTPREEWLEDEDTVIIAHKDKEQRVDGQLDVLRDR